MFTARYELKYYIWVRSYRKKDHDKPEQVHTKQYAVGFRGELDRKALSHCFHFIFQRIKNVFFASQKSHYASSTKCVLSLANTLPSEPNVLYNYWIRSFRKCFYIYSQNFSASEAWNRWSRENAGRNKKERMARERGIQTAGTWINMVNKYEFRVFTYES
jgi:hypothetical protein